MIGEPVGPIEHMADVSGIEQAYDQAIQDARVAGAQMEWERWKRSNGVAAAGLRTSAYELRKLAKRQADLRAERDVERMAATLDELALQVDGENWLKSPEAMAALRAQEART